LAKSPNKDITYLITTPQTDPFYPNFADFQKVPYGTSFVHAVGDYKRQEVVARHLSYRLRQDYPANYYHILRVCQESGVMLHNPVYTTPTLLPNKHTDAYFERLEFDYQSFDCKDIRYFYGKSMAVYRDVERLYGLPFENILQQQIVLSNDVTITEETEPTLKQTLKLVNLQSLQYEEHLLDNLDMVLYDAFLAPKPINEAITEVSQYFPKEEIENDYAKFQNLVLDRIKIGLYLGVLETLQAEVARLRAG
jgi:hypothetical protein